MEQPSQVALKISPTSTSTHTWSHCVSWLTGVWALPVLQSPLLHFQVVGPWARCFLLWASFPEKIHKMGMMTGILTGYCFHSTNSYRAVTAPGIWEQSTSLTRSLPLWSLHHKVESRQYASKQLCKYKQPWCGRKEDETSPAMEVFMEQGAVREMRTGKDWPGGHVKGSFYALQGLMSTRGWGKRGSSNGPCFPNHGTLVLENHLH